MAVKTSNYYGKLIITDNAIAMTAHQAASECYGVMQLVSRTLTDSLCELFKRPSVGKGVKVTTIDNKINLELFVELKAGVNLSAVSDSLQETVKYCVETYTGMRVTNVTVHVVGVRV